MRKFMAGAVIVTAGYWVGYMTVLRFTDQPVFTPDAVMDVGNRSNKDNGTDSGTLKKKSKKKPARRGTQSTMRRGDYSTGSKDNAGL